MNGCFCISASEFNYYYLQFQYSNLLEHLRVIEFE